MPLELSFNPQDEKQVTALVEYIDRMFPNFVSDKEFDTLSDLFDYDVLSPFLELSPSWGMGGNLCFYKLEDGRIAYWHSDASELTIGAQNVTEESVTREIKEIL